MPGHRVVSCRVRNVSIDTLETFYHDKFMRAGVRLAVIHGNSSHFKSILCNSYIPKPCFRCKLGLACDIDADYALSATFGLLKATARASSMTTAFTSVSVSADGRCRYQGLWYYVAYHRLGGRRERLAAPTQREQVLGTPHLGLARRPTLHNQAQLAMAAEEESKRISPEAFHLSAR